MYYVILQHDGDYESVSTEVTLCLEKEHAELIATSLNEKAFAESKLAELTPHLGNLYATYHYYVRTVDELPLVMAYCFEELDEGGAYVARIDNVTVHTEVELQNLFQWALRHRIILVEA